MLFKTIFSTFFLSFFLSSLARAVGDPSSGKVLAKQCTACHGANGQSIVDHWPNLRGQKAGYIFKELNRYKSRSRKHLMMEHIADALSKQDMEDLAAYFSQMSNP